MFGYSSFNQHGYKYQSGKADLLVSQTAAQQRRPANRCANVVLIRHNSRYQAECSLKSAYENCSPSVFPKNEGQSAIADFLVEQCKNAFGPLGVLSYCSRGWRNSSDGPVQLKSV